MKETLGIVAFVHLLAHWFRDHEEEWTNSNTPLKRWIFRENKWRAIRYGVKAEIVATRNGKTKLLSRDIKDWIKILEPYAKQLQYQQYLHLVEEIVAKGNSSDRQHAVFTNTGDLMEVVRHSVKEFELGFPNWN